MKEPEPFAFGESDAARRDPAMVERLQALLAAAAAEPEAHGDATRARAAVAALGKMLEQPIRVGWLRRAADIIDYDEARSTMLESLATGASLFGTGKRKTLHATWKPDRASLRSFAYRSALRRFADWRRHLIKQREVPLAAGVAENSQLDPTAVWGGGSYAFPPDRLAHSRELWPALERLLPALPAKERQAVELRVYYSLTPAEIADAMDVTPSAAHNLVNRGSMKLKELLAAKGFSPNI